MPDAKPKAEPEAVNEAPKGLIAKLAEVMGEMRSVEKKGHNKAQNYDFVRESDVAELASKLLAERRVWIHQTVVKHELIDLYTTQSGSLMRLSIVEVEFRFIDGDSGETTETQTFPGYGADTGDKGIYKAMTGAEKYFLMKSFLVSTGDDPEGDERTDRAAAAAGASSGPRVQRGRQAGVQRGGRSDIATAAQVNDVARFVRDLGLTAETFPPILEGILKAKPAEGQNTREFLSALKSEDIGKLISALAELQPPQNEAGEEADAPAAEDDGDEPQDALSVV